jgi:hemerythrin
MFIWKDAYKIGIKDIDEQHEQLLGIGRSIYELTNAHPDVYDSEELMDLIEELCSYTIYHFETEERFLEKNNYPDIDAHIQQHQRFVEFLTKLNVDDIEHHTSQSLTKLLKFINGWITNHVLIEDLKFSTQIQKYL